MVRRYVEILEYIRQVNHQDVKQLLLTEDENKEVSELLRRLSAMDSVTIELQSDSTTLLDARNLFVGLIQKYPRFSTRLSACFKIVENESF